jgi:hypothetical protein
MHGRAVITAWSPAWTVVRVRQHGERRFCTAMSSVQFHIEAGSPEKNFMGAQT